MHTLNRFLTCLLLIAVLVPPATFALVSLDEKSEAQEDLQEAIGTAVSKYQQRTGLQGMKTRGEKTIQDSETKLVSLERRKRELRAGVIKQKRILRSIGERYDMTFDSKEAVQTLIATEKRRMERIVRAQYLRAFDPTDPKSIILNTVFYAAAEHGESVITRTQEQFLHDLLAAEKALWRLEVIETERDSVLAQYRDTLGKYDSAIELVERSADQLEEIKAIMEEVHGHVIRMQGDLARIDARLKEKAERELIEMGLLDPKTAGATDGVPVRPQFSWPVYGRVSSGFMNESYRKFFGVPHHGLDIVVGQETPVASAAEGVVFLVRDGGKTGYSYILVGHRGGFATLYGHVSQALVTAGQMVTAGQAIALSGGQPGSHGAGPMTTGPHLHFEVIQAGVNIDPKSVLP